MNDGESVYSRTQLRLGYIQWYWLDARTAGQALPAMSVGNMNISSQW